MMEEKLVQLHAKLEADQSLAEKLLAMETPEEVQGLLKTEGLDFALEEINMLRDALIKSLLKGENDELSDEDLEDVAGGLLISTIITVICACLGTALGVASTTNNITRGRW